jgi:hypothetical protein
MPRKKKTVKSNIEVKAPTNEQRDYQKFHTVKEDVGFSPERNKAIIEKTIREYEKMLADRKKQYKEKIEERVEATMAYANFLDKGGNADAPAEKYFGKRTLANLRGQRIIKELKGNYFVLRDLENDNEIYIP